MRGLCVFTGATLSKSMSSERKKAKEWVGGVNEREAGRVKEEDRKWDSEKGRDEERDIETKIQIVRDIHA